MFSRLARPSSSNACVMRCAILRFWSGERPSTQVTFTCGIWLLLLMKNAAHCNRCPRWKPTPTQKNPSACLRGRGLQFCPAVGADAPTSLHGAAALRAGEPQSGAAIRTEGETSINRFPAHRAGARQGITQQKIKDDPDEVRNENRQERPHDVTHSAALGIAIDVADQRNPDQENQPEPESKERLLPWVPKAHFFVGGKRHQPHHQRKTYIHCERDDPRGYGDHAQRANLVFARTQRRAVARAALGNHASFFSYKAHANLPSRRRRTASTAPATPAVTQPNAV